MSLRAVGTRWRATRWQTASLALVGAAVAVTAVAVAARSGMPFGPDLAVWELVEANSPPLGRRIAATTTLLGTGPVLYPLLLAVCLLAAVRRRNAYELLPVPLLAAGQVLERVMFAPLHRPAPAGEAAGLLATTFTSGRTAAAVLGWGLIAWQASRLRGSPGESHGRTTWALALSLGVVVGATRVHLGMQWVSDALVGVATGSVMFAAARAAMPPLLTLPPPRCPPPPVAAATSPRARTRLGRWLRSSPWAWSVPAGAALVPIVGILASPPAGRMKDLLVYYGAGTSVGVGDNLYAFQTVFGMPFTYPPFATLVLEPIARMPLGVAQTLWTIATLGAVVAVAGTALRPVADRIGLPLTIAALLVSSPVRSHFRFGQVGLFLVLLISLDLLERTRHRGRGLGLGLAIAIKLTPAVFLPWLAATRQWRRLTATLLWAGAATVLGLVLLWPSTGEYLLSAAWDTGRFGANDIPGNQSIRGMLLRVLPDQVAQVAWLGLVLPLAAVGTYQAWWCERHGDRLAAVGILAALSVAVSPISWVHHLVFLTLPLAALVAAGRLRLAAAWFGVLTISFPYLGSTMASLGPLAHLVTNLPGLTAVAAAILLPSLVRREPERARAA